MALGSDESGESPLPPVEKPGENLSKRQPSSATRRYPDQARRAHGQAYCAERLGHAPRDVSIIINRQELRTVEQTEVMIA
jgi:hypothetical protein